MNFEELQNSARFYADLYKNDHLIRATVLFDETCGHLTASYIFDHDPDEEDKEECELFCGELVGAFPEIRTAQTICIKDGEPGSAFRENNVEAFSRR